MHYANYFESINITQLIKAFPTGNAFMTRYVGMSTDELRSNQSKLLLRQLGRAAQIPFYRRLWANAGADYRDVKSIEDLHLLPSFGKAEIMASIEAHPPFGDHHGRDIPVDGSIVPMILHATSGTTGRPQPLLYSPKTREVQNILLARAYLMQGMAPTDVVHSVYGHGPVNGGHYIREAVVHHTGAVFFPAGTGVETPSIKQVQLMQEFGATVLVGFADYLLRLAQVAREADLQPGRDIPVRMISGHLPADARTTLADAWGGAELFDWYGVGDTGLIAAEGPDHDGLHVMEDAHWLEICDLDTDAPISSASTPGNMIVSCLFTDDLFPIVRFNTHDVSEFLTSESSLNLPFRRIKGFMGRSDNMVKLRGINVYPQAFSSLLAGMPGFNGEFICAMFDEQKQVAMRVQVECTETPTAALCAHYEQTLQQKLGVHIPVQLVAPQSLAQLTGVESRQKPIRLIDERNTHD